MPASIFAGSKVKTLKDTLTLNGKSDIISSTVDPTASAVDAPIGSLLINQTSGKLYRKLDPGSSVNWEEVGAGVGGINYILNPSAEVNTTGWATYADAAGTAPVDGTGGSPNVTWTRSTTSPLRGVANFNFAKDAANRQGQGVSYDFTIALADKAKVLSVTFDYEVLSGTYADGDLTVYLIADPTGTPVVIQPAGYTVLSATSGTTMRQRATFQTQATGTSYRLCFHVASTSASAYTLAIDNVVVGPQQTVQGAAISDWVSYTPTFSGMGGAPATTFTLTKANYRRVGDSMQIRISGRFVNNGSGGTAVTFSLPAGSIDLTKIDDGSGTNFGYAGDATFFNLVGAGYAGVQTKHTVYVSSSTALGFIRSGTTGALTGADILNTTEVDLFATVPISGWSSNTVMSQDTDTRVVAARYKTASATVTGIASVVKFTSADYDTHASYSTSTGLYTVSVSGKYKIAATVFGGGTFTAGQDFSLHVYKNASEIAFKVNRQQAAHSNSCSYDITTEVDCNSGDTLAIYVSSNATTPSVGGIAAREWLTIERLSGPATIGASETVAIFASKITGSQTSSGSFQDVASWTVRDSTHGAFDATTGVFTAPISGRFLVTGILNFTGNVTGSRAVKIVKGSADTVIGQIQAANGTSNALPFSGYLQLLAGETAKLQAYQNSGGNLSYVASTEFGTTISFIRVGN